MGEGYTVSSGVREVNGTRLAYDLYIPTGRSAALAGILLLHGFGADRRSLAGHAARLAGAGVAAVLTPDMSSLMSGGVELARSRNIAQAADQARLEAECGPECAALRENEPLIAQLVRRATALGDRPGVEARMLLIPQACQPRASAGCACTA